MFQPFARPHKNKNRCLNFVSKGHFLDLQKHEENNARTINDLASHICSEGVIRFFVNVENVGVLF